MEETVGPEGTASRLIAADRPYGEFYDFYSVSTEYFGFILGYYDCKINWFTLKDVLWR
jgi:hypothetical protein